MTQCRNQQELRSNVVERINLEEIVPARPLYRAGYGAGYGWISEYFSMANSAYHSVPGNSPLTIDFILPTGNFERLKLAMRSVRR